MNWNNVDVELKGILLRNWLRREIAWEWKRDI